MKFRILLKNLLFEDKASRAEEQARKILLPAFKNDDAKVDQTIKALENDLPFLKNNMFGGKGRKFFPAVARMFIKADFGNQNNMLDIVTKFNSVMICLIKNHYDEYDSFLNPPLNRPRRNHEVPFYVSPMDIIKKYEEEVEDEIDTDRHNNSLIASKLTKNESYAVVTINSFEQANTYHKYVNWCTVNDKSSFYSYTSNGYNQMYFCLLKGYENVKKLKVIILH